MFRIYRKVLLEAMLILSTKRDIYLTKVVFNISESIMLTGVTSNNRKIIVAANLRGFFG